jgi:hypothetical protein
MTVGRKGFIRAVLFFASFFWTSKRNEEKQGKICSNALNSRGASRLYDYNTVQRPGRVFGFVEGHWIMGRDISLKLCPAPAGHLYSGFVYLMQICSPRDLYV